MAVIGLGGLAAGDLDREITVQTATAATDDSGFPYMNWATATSETVWAQFLPAGTSEAWKAQQRLGSYVDAVFRIYDMDTRPSPDTARIVFDGKTFDIKGVTEIGRGEGLEVTATARGETT